MNSTSEVVSIRLPIELLEKIDEVNQVVGFSQSRAEYVVKAMDTLFRTLVDNRIRIDAQLDALKKAQEIDPTTILAITKAAIDRFMEKYEQYTGQKSQVLLRIPPKMLEAIDTNATVIGLYSTRSDFIKMAVSNQIELDYALIEKLKRIKEHRIFQKRETTDIINSILDDLSKRDSEGLDGLIDLANVIIRETGRERQGE